MGWSCWRYPIISSFGPCQEISSVLKCSRKPSCTQYCCLQGSVLAVDHGVGHTPPEIHGMMCPDGLEMVYFGVPLLRSQDSGTLDPSGVWNMVSQTLRSPLSAPARRYPLSLSAPVSLHAPNTAVCRAPCWP